MFKWCEKGRSEINDTAMVLKKKSGTKRSDISERTDYREGHVTPYRRGEEKGWVLLPVIDGYRKLGISCLLMTFSSS